MNPTVQKIVFAALFVLTLLWTGFATFATGFALAWSMVRAEDVTAFLLGKPRLLLLILSPLVPLTALIAVERHRTSGSDQPAPDQPTTSTSKFKKRPTSLR